MRAADGQARPLISAPSGSVAVLTLLTRSQLRCNEMRPGLSLQPRKWNLGACGSRTQWKGPLRCEQRVTVRSTDQYHLVSPDSGLFQALDSGRAKTVGARSRMDRGRRQSDLYRLAEPGGAPPKLRVGANVSGQRKHQLLFESVLGKLAFRFIQPNQSRDPDL